MFPTFGGLKGYSDEKWMSRKKTPPSYTDPGGPRMVDTHSYRLSPLGPALQLGGGSSVISASSFWILHDRRDHRGMLQKHTFTEGLPPPAAGCGADRAAARQVQAETGGRTASPVIESPDNCWPCSEVKMRDERAARER